MITGVWSMFKIGKERYDSEKETTPGRFDSDLAKRDGSGSADIFVTKGEPCSW
jgi:hypothetical protein